MFNVKGFNDNPNVIMGQAAGPFQIVEYKQDMSIDPSGAMPMYFFSKMGGRRRQLVMQCNQGIILQAGEMQLMVGDVKLTSGYKGVGDIIGKAFRSKVSGESMTMPEYQGSGLVVTEPTYKHLHIIDVAIEWNGGVVLEDGIFLACEQSLEQKLAARKTISSAVAGGEGMFNMSLQLKKGANTGFAVLELPCPYSELIEVDLQNDVVKIDGNMAIAWSSTLDFTVERAGQTLIGSAVSGEGLVNVYRGTGKVLIRPKL